MMPQEFEGWYFEHGMLCTPEGDRFTALCIRACFFIRQMQEFGCLIDTCSHRHSLAGDGGLKDLLTHHATAESIARSWPVRAATRPT